MKSCSGAAGNRLVIKKGKTANKRTMAITALSSVVGARLAGFTKCALSIVSYTPHHRHHHRVLFMLLVPDPLSVLIMGCSYRAAQRSS